MEIAVLLKAFFFNGIGTSALLLALISLFDFECEQADLQCLKTLSMQGDVPGSFYAILAVGFVFLVIGGAVGLKEAKILTSLWQAIQDKFPSLGGAGE
ncbi:hypothetical protein [Parasphingorhabdus sp.]|uniref:hypothetical protein n=1 Tax=Parasphingorhabdus sp. TaxID=2709688 RepID=UPI003C76E537